MLRIIKSYEWLLVLLQLLFRYSQTGESLSLRKNQQVCIIWVMLGTTAYKKDLLN